MSFGNADRPVIQRREVRDALVQRQPTHRDRIRESGGLQVPFGPPQALHGERLEIDGRQSGDQHFIQVDGFPSLRVQHDRRVQVFGDGLGEDAAVRLERLAPQHRASAAEERRVPVVLARHDQVEERVLLAVHPPVLPAHVVLDGIEVVVLLRHLDDGDLRVAEESERAVEELRARHVIGVERRDEVRVRLPEGVVPVAGLGVSVVRARDVVAPNLVGQRAHRLTTAVVEHVSLVRIPHRHRRTQRLSAAGRRLRCRSSRRRPPSGLTAPARPAGRADARAGGNRGRGKRTREARRSTRAARRRSHRGSA